jgi:hypothetical protein
MLGMARYSTRDYLRAWVRRMTFGVAGLFWAMSYLLWRDTDEHWGAAVCVAIALLLTAYCVRLFSTMLRDPQDPPSFGGGASH